jgi:CheY-like chemotaxis protein
VPGQSAEDGGPFRILIAEDVEANRRFLVKLLHPFGIEMREANNGAEAIAIWQTWQPHLIFMDLRMAGMDGLEATQRIKATTQGHKPLIIMLTASAFEEDREAALAQGCDDIMRKPVREKQISRPWKSTWESNLCMSQPPPTQHRSDSLCR